MERLLGKGTFSRWWEAKHSQGGKQQEGLQGAEVEIPLSPAISPLGIFPKDLKV